MRTISVTQMKIAEIAYRSVIPDEQLDRLLYQGVSNCCGKPIYKETDVCSACGEHTALQCENCEGVGLIREHAREFDIDERIRDCKECDGKGWIEL